MVVSVSLIRNGYQYGTVPDRRGSIHTESGRTFYTCSTSFHYDMAGLLFYGKLSEVARAILISDRHIDLLLPTEVAFLQSNIGHQNLFLNDHKHF